MRKLLTTLLITAALIAPAAARTAVWSRDNIWTVVGDTELKFCTATKRHADGTEMHIARNVTGWNLSFSGLAVTQGQNYAVKMATVTATGTLIGTATNNGQVVFFNIDGNTLINLFKSKALAVEGLGVYTLKGSAAAMAETLACFKAMTGRDA